MQPTTTSPTPITPLHDENILVVKRDLLFPEDAWHGIRRDHVTVCIQTIMQHQEFQPRSLMEQDPRYKQIIPYLIFTHGDRYFLMQRQAKSTEQRLASKYSLGIGGHMREEDIRKSNSKLEQNGEFSPGPGCTLDWAQREFDEEVKYEGACTFEPLGILNDDSNAVGHVHLGLVLLVRGEHPNISVKSELKSGVLLSLDEIRDFYPMMEGWSQMVFDMLVSFAS